MPQATVTPVISHIDVGISKLPVRGTFSVSSGTYGSNLAGSPPVGGGISVSFVGLVQVTTITPAPNSTFVHGLSGYSYVFDDAFQSLRIFNGLTELTYNSSVPAAVQNDVISFEAQFSKR